MRKIALAFILYVAASFASVAHAEDTIAISGQATNVTVNATSGVSFKITQDAQYTYRAQGSYDSKNLFGRFDVLGVRLPLCTGTRSICLQFIGEINLGGDGSGFPDGTKSSYVMSIVIEGQSAKGVYHIGVLPGLQYEQYGILTATVE